jgi:hypothetical protein
MAAVGIIDKGIKARRRRHSVTVPVRRGWNFSLALPILPATITFDGTAVVYQAGSPETHSVLNGLGLLTYAPGVPLRKMSNPAAGLARVLAGQEGGPR